MAVQPPTSRLYNKQANITTCALLSPVLANRPDEQSLLTNLQPLISSINIYENIFSPVLTGELFLQDDVGISSLVPLIGIETFLLSFNIVSPSGEVRYYGNPNPLKFAVYQETDRRLKTQGTETLRLGLVSPELITMSEQKISLPYDNVKIEDVVVELFSKYGNSKKKFVDLEKTKTPINMVVPYMSPLDLVKLLTLQGQNAESDSNFNLYETLDGFHFSSINYMKKEGNKVKTQNIPRITMTMKGLEPSKYSLRNISAEAIDIVSGFDLLYQISHGGFASVTLGLDVLSGKYRRIVTTSNDDKFKNRDLTNGKGAAPIYPSSFGRIANPTNKMYLVPTLAISAANSAITSKDPSIKNNYIEQTLDSREFIALQSKTVRVKVAGVPEIRAGSLVDIEIPLPINNNSLAPVSKDVASGRYLVVAAKHSIINTGTGNFVYETIFEACSDSYSK